MSTSFATLKGVAVIFIAVFIASCNKNSGYHSQPPAVNANITSGAGDSIAVTIKLNAFRTIVGNPLNTTPGVTGGRREVNWDAVPVNLTNNNNFPFDFFAAADAALPNGRKRGLVLSATGNSFRVDSTQFSEIDNSYITQFSIFSPKRLFITASTNITEVSFKVPGTTTNAYVKSFGVVFCDVDNADASAIEYFNGSKSLGVYKPLTAAQGFSFLGVSFPDEKVTKVRITAGNGSLAAGAKDISNAGSKDIVVMDDFIYDEPKTLD